MSSDAPNCSVEAEAGCPLQAVRTIAVISRIPSVKENLDFIYTPFESIEPIQFMSWTLFVLIKFPFIVSSRVPILVVKRSTFEGNIKKASEYYVPKPFLSVQLLGCL